MAEEKKIDPRTVLLKRVRLSFADGLVEKKSVPGVKDSRPRHGFNLIIESEGDDEKAKQFAEANKTKCLSAIEAACHKEWGKPDKWKQIQEDSPKRVTFRKGERFKNDDGKVYPGYAGNFVISTCGPKAGQYRPKMFDRHRIELDPRDPKYLEQIEEICYSGSYVDAFVSFYGGDDGGAGVFSSVEAIRSHQEGAATGGGGIAVKADMFDAFDDEDGDDALG